MSDQKKAPRSVAMTLASRSIGRALFGLKPGRPPLQLLDEELSNELAILRDAFASTSIDGEFRNWVLLFTAQDSPRRALLEIFGELRDCLFRIRNTLSQRFNVSLAERRTGFHLSLDRVHDALPGEPTLVDRE